MVITPLIIGIAILAFGFVLAFYGYPTFRIILPLYGAVLGYVIGTALFQGSAAAPVIGLVLAAVFAMLSYTAWGFLLGISGGLMGFALGALLGSTLLPGEDLIALALALLSMVIFALAFYRSRDLMVIVVTALNGGVAVSYGAREVLAANAVDVTTWQLPLLVGMVVIAVLGLVFQLSRFGRRRTYS